MAACSPDNSGPSAWRQHAILAAVCLTFFSFSISTALFTAASLLSLALWVMGGAWQQRDTWRQPWLLPVIALVLLPWFGLLWTSAPLSEAVSLAGRGHYWLFALVACFCLATEQRVRMLLSWYVAGSVLVAVMVMLYLAGLLPENAYLNKFQFVYYIAFSLHLVVALLVLAWFYRSSVRPVRIAILLLMLFLAVTITCLKGRSAYLALALMAPWMCVTMFGRRRILPVCISLALTVAVLMSSATVRNRLALISREVDLYRSGSALSYRMPDGSEMPSSIGLRMVMWKNALEIFRRQPLLGAGTAGYLHETGRIDPGHRYSHPHNSYLYVAASYGLLGLGLYGWLLFVTLRRAWQARDRLSGHCILSFVFVILIASLTDTQIITAATGVALGFVVGIPTGEQA